MCLTAIHRRGVSQIFAVADRDGDGSLSKDEVVGLMQALNPMLKLTEKAADHLAWMVLDRYGSFVRGGGLTMEGLALSYQDRAGCVERDMVVLGLDIPEAFLHDDEHGITASLEAGSLPEPSPGPARPSAATELLAGPSRASASAQTADSVNNVCAGPNPWDSSSYMDSGEFILAMQGGGEPTAEDIPGLVEIARQGYLPDAQGQFQPAQVVAAALGMLCNLTADSLESREAVRLAGGLDALPPLLVLKNYNDGRARVVSSKAAVLVANLTVGSPANQTGMRAAGVILVLVRMLQQLVTWGKTDSSLAEKIIAALWSLVYENSANKEELCDSGGIPALVAVLDPLESSKESGMKAGLTLWCLARDNCFNQDAIREAGGITVLSLIIRRFVANESESTAQLVSTDMAVIALSAVQALTNQNQDNCQAFRLASGIPPIVQLLRGHPKNKLTWMAAACLWTVANHNYDNQEAIREARGIPHLVALLQGHSCMPCLENTMGALRVLALDNDINRDAIRLSEGVSAIIKLLSALFQAGKGLMVQCLATAALAALASQSEPNQTVILQQGGTRLLCDMLGSATDIRLIDHVASALLELSTDNRRAAIDVAEHRTIPLLAHHLSTDATPQQTKEKMAGILCSLANTGKDYQDEIRSVGGIDLLSQMLLTGDPWRPAMQNAVAALCNLAHDNEDNRNAIRDAGCVPGLVYYLEHADSLAAKEKAVGALCNLAYTNAANKVHIGASGAIPLLLNVLEAARGGDGRIYASLAERTVGTLCTLQYQNAANQAAIRENGGMGGHRISWIGHRGADSDRRPSVSLGEIQHYRRKSAGAEMFDFFDSQRSMETWQTTRGAMASPRLTQEGDEARSPPHSARPSASGGAFASLGEGHPRSRRTLSMRPDPTMEGGQDAAKGSGALTCDDPLSRTISAPVAHNSDKASSSPRQKLSKIHRQISKTFTFSKASKTRMAQQQAHQQPPTLEAVTSQSQLSPRSATRAYFGLPPRSDNPSLHNLLWHDDKTVPTQKQFRG